MDKKGYPWKGMEKWTKEIQAYNQFTYISNLAIHLPVVPFNFNLVWQRLKQL